MAKKRNPPKKLAANPPARLPKAVARTTATPLQTDFDVVLELINSARIRAVAAANKTLIELYWSIGEYISQQIATDGWGGGNRRGSGRVHPEAPAECPGLLRPQPLADDAVL